MAPKTGTSSRRALLTIFFTVLLDLLGFGMILPLLPFYPQQFGVTDVEIGWLFASYSLAQLVCSPFLGRMSDRFGRRPLLLTTLVLAVAAHLVFAFAGSFLVLIVARSASGVAASNLGIAQAFIADVTAREDRSKGMGMIGAAFGLGFVLGPALGGVLGHWGHQAVPLGAACLSAVNLLLAVAWLPESRPPELRRRQPRQLRGSWLDLGWLRRLAGQGPVFGLILLFFTVTLCFALMEVTIVLYCQDVFGFGHVETSWLFVFLGVTMVIVQGGLVGRVTRVFGETRTIPAGILLITAGMLLLPVSRPPWLTLLLIAAGLLAVGAGLHNPTSLGLLSRLTPDDEQGRTLGVSRSFGALARVLGPLAGTWLYQEQGQAWPFHVGGTVLGVTFFAAVALLRDVPDSRRPTAGAAADSAETLAPSE